MGYFTMERHLTCHVFEVAKFAYCPLGQTAQIQNKFLIVYGNTHKMYTFLRFTEGNYNITWAK